MKLSWSPSFPISCADYFLGLGCLECLMRFQPNFAIHCNTCWILLVHVLNLIQMSELCQHWKRRTNCNCLQILQILHWQMDQTVGSTCTCPHTPWDHSTIGLKTAAPGRPRNPRRTKSRSSRCHRSTAGSTKELSRPAFTLVDIGWGAVYSCTNTKQLSEVTLDIPGSSCSCRNASPRFPYISPPEMAMCWCNRRSSFWPADCRHARPTDTSWCWSRRPNHAHHQASNSRQTSVHDKNFLQHDRSWRRMIIAHRATVIHGPEIKHTLSWQAISWPCLGAVHPALLITEANESDLKALIKCRYLARLEMDWVPAVSPGIFSTQLF